ncbi:MAG: TerB family tellurite resistance protein [Alphaproteobacteria bacterium]|nr:TerB family tellurite resistance protein [Alphaproteobacteria bacterium]MCB9975514.1 TerB family tellurite resistance protein [Rhodospirillales bacterium]
MSGNQSTAAGIVFLILGVLAIGLYQAQVVSNPMVMGGGSISLALGGFLLIFGRFGAAFKEYAPPSGIHRGDTAIFSHTLIRCMIAITVADDVLEDDEIKAVRSIYKRVTGSDISAKLVTDTAQGMMDSGVDIMTELRNTQASLDKESKDKIIIASLYILAADGVMDEGEELFLEDIRDGLKVPLARFNKIKKSFLASRSLKKRSAS